jgi:hypothetical protein
MQWKHLARHPLEVTQRPISRSSYHYCRERVHFFKEKNIKTALVSCGLEDTEKLTDLARQHDVKLDITTDYNTVIMKLFIKGLQFLSAAKPRWLDDLNSDLLDIYISV